MCTRWSPEAGMVLLYWGSHRTVLSSLTWGQKIAGQGLERFTRQIKASSIISEWSLLAMNLKKKGLKHHKILYKLIGCFGSASNNWPSVFSPSFPLVFRRHLFGAVTASQHILWPSALSYWQGFSESLPLSHYFITVWLKQIWFAYTEGDTSQTLPIMKLLMNNDPSWMVKLSFNNLEVTSLQMPTFSAESGSATSSI